MKGKEMIWIMLIAAAVVFLAFIKLKGSCCGGSCPLQPPQAPEKAPSDQTAIVIDTRSQEEYDQGHIAGAPLMPYDQIGQLIGKQVPDKKTPIKLYCHSGGRSESARRTLMSMGYLDVKNLGGMKSAAETLKKDVVK